MSCFSEPDFDIELDLDSSIEILPIEPEEKNLNLKSINFLTKYEKIQCLALRANQISCGSKIYVEYTTLDTPLDIAKREMEQKKLPFKIKRVFPNGYSEFFTLN